MKLSENTTMIDCLFDFLVKVQHAPTPQRWRCFSSKVKTNSVTKPLVWRELRFQVHIGMEKWGGGVASKIVQSDCFNSECDDN